MIQFHTMVHSCFAFETENNIYNPLKQSDAEAEENIDHNINLHLIGNILQFSWRYRFSISIVSYTSPASLFLFLCTRDARYLVK